MPGVIYLLLCAAFGWIVLDGFYPYAEKKNKEAENRFWVVMPASLGVGILLITWAVYGTAWFFYAVLGSEKPLMWSNGIVLGCAGLILAVVLGLRICRGRKLLECRKLILHKKLFRKESLFFTALFVFLIWIMFYVFYIRDGVLYSGFTVYGDYAPHTAMMRSFSMQNNYPTQYPHFGGEDVKYHFMFQFLIGNLEYLGMRLDFAYNLVSALVLLGFLMLLYTIGKKVTGRAWAGVLAVIFFIFRSALTFFRFLWENFKSGTLLKALAENTAFIGYTENENWGLWNFNVYLNQRHLAFGLLITAFVIWGYLDWVEAGCEHQEKGLLWMKKRFFSREAWKYKSVEHALAAGLLLGLASFWNGAAVIGGLLILMGFAFFSDGKLDYLITAIMTVLLSFLQTKIFIRGSAVKASFYWGFILEDKSLKGVLWYLFQMSGFFFLGAAILFFWLKKRSQRALLVGFLFPLVFAFTMSLTPDVTVNHKYIMISYGFLTIFWAGFVVSLFSKKRFQKMLAVFLAICLTATGVYDFVIILRNNGPGHRVTVRLDSPLTEWLAENLHSSDLILTPEYSISEVTMAGVMMYLGWPYYAWSAGYDTYGRAEKAKTIYTVQDENQVRSLVQQEKITYILFEEGMTFEGENCSEDTIKKIYPLVYETEDRRIRIYET